MLKQLHSFILSVIIVCFLSVSQVAFGEIETNSLQEGIPKDDVGYVQNNIRDTNLEPMNTESIKKSVIPDPAKEGKKVIGLFIKMMIAVAFSALLIYALLLLVKKYYPVSFSNSDNNDDDNYENLDLSTPDSKNDALKSFLNRTK